MRSRGRRCGALCSRSAGVITSPPRLSPPVPTSVPSRPPRDRRSFSAQRARRGYQSACGRKKRYLRRYRHPAEKKCAAGRRCLKPSSRGWFDDVILPSFDAPQRQKRWLQRSQKKTMFCYQYGDAQHSSLKIKHAEHGKRRCGAVGGEKSALRTTECRGDDPPPKPSV